jgi:IS1 family transposase
MNKLSIEKQARVIASLVEGNSIRSTVRMTGVAKGTVTRLLVDVGNACADFHGRTVRNVSAKRVQCDEIWSFVGMKKKNVPVEKRRTFGVGDVWTWTALDADSKLIVSWLVGDRERDCATAFMKDLAARLSRRPQITTDGYGAYPDAVDTGFGDGVDYAQLIKIFRTETGTGAARYSPPRFVKVETIRRMGNPDSRHISTSFVERQNLTMRMSMRRFTRLTNAFSKKVENHAAAIALHFVHYNFARIHQTLRVTPAIAAGLTDHLWTIEDLIRLAEKPAIDRFKYANGN